MGEALPEYQMGSGNSPLGWVLSNTGRSIAHTNGNKINYDLSPDNLNKLRTLCPTDTDVYRLSGLSLYDKDSVKGVSIKMNKDNEFVFSLKSYDGFSLQYTVNIDSKICTINNMTKQTNDTKSYDLLICRQLRNMKSMGIKEIHLWAAKSDGKYGYNVRPIYGYDIKSKECMIDSLEYVLNYGKGLSFNGLYTDDEIKTDLKHFISLYGDQDNSIPDLLMPLLFEWPKLRNMRRQSGINMSLHMVLMDNHPTWRFFDTNFPENEVGL